MRTFSLLAGGTSLALAGSLIVPAVLAQSGSPASAQHAASHAPSLFGAAPAAAQRRVADTSQGAVERSRYVSVKTGLLRSAAKGQQLDLPFFDDVDLTATITHIDRQKLFTSWSGSLDTSLGTFVATKTGSIWSVTANTPHGNYGMTRTASGLYQVTETAGPVPTVDDETPVPATAGQGADAAGRTTAHRAAKRAKVGDDGSVTDILVAYTATAAAQYGGVAGIQAEAAKNIAYTNAAYQNSGVQTVARLVAVVPVTGSEQGGDLDADLVALQKAGDGVFDEVFGYVQQYHADDTLLLERQYDYPNDSACGRGYRGATTDQISTAYAFSVVLTGDCTANGYPTFPHELGHNQSASHDFYTSTTPGAGYSSTPALYPYGYGYVAPNYAWRTVMSYNRKCTEVGGLPNYSTTCPAILWFSNPNVSYGGQATGTAAEENVALAISQTRGIVAGHQQSQLYPQPVKIKGQVQPGHRVRAKYLKWVNTSVKYRYSWYRNGKLIKGAKHKTYQVKARDVGKKLSVLVTGAKPYYTNVAIGSKARKVKGHKHGHKHGHHGHHHRVLVGGTATAAAAVVRPRLLDDRL